MTTARKTTKPSEEGALEASVTSLWSPYVMVLGRGGLPTYFFPWDVLKIEAGTEAGRGTITLARDGANVRIPYENMEAGDIAAEVWAGMQRGAATALLNQVHHTGLEQVIQGVMRLVEPEMRQWLDTARTEEIRELVSKHVTQALMELAKKRPRVSANVIGGS